MASSDPLDHVVQHALFTVRLAGHDYVITNHIMMMFAAATIMIIVLPIIARRWTMAPRGFYNFIEGMCVFLREEVAKPILHEDTDKYISYVWTVFFFILLCNLLGMAPVGAVLYWLTHKNPAMLHWGGTATANIWITGALASMSFLMIHISGIRQQGLWHYVVNFIPKVPWPLVPMMYILEIAGSFVKPFALAIRLFANMLAGHLVLGSLMILAMASKSYAIAGVTVLGSAVLSLLELFVAFLQAYIFTFLTTMFIGAAVHPEH